MTPIFDPTRPVYLLGGGASLSDFDWGKLYRQQCIAINTAYRKVPWANVLFFSDHHFFEQYRDPQGAHFWQFSGERIITTAEACKNAGGRVEYLDPSELALSEGDHAFSAVDTNSGVQAILLAHLLGAHRIVLLGYDNLPGHWHDGTPLAHANRVDDDAYATYAADFAKLAECGLDVVNASDRTALTCFPVVPRDSAF